MEVHDVPDEQNTAQLDCNLGWGGDAVGTENDAAMRQNNTSCHLQHEAEKVVAT